jgi:chromosome segregation ATPase
MSEKPESPEQSTDPVKEITPESAGKLFTQEQLDAVISQRLERERLSKSQDLEEVKSEIGKLSETVETKDKQISQYEEILKGIIKGQLKDLPKPVKQLVEKLDPAEQLVWLENNADELKSTAKKPISPIPNPSELEKVDVEEIITKKQDSGKYNPTI